MRVTHPFHPLAGFPLRRVGEQANVAGRRILCQDTDGHIHAVPIEWTDLTEPDVAQQIGAGRAYVRVQDLLDLAELVARMTRS